MEVAFAISTTFYLIFVAEALGNNDFIVGMTYVGILVIVQMAIHTIFDYPTGVISTIGVLLINQAFQHPRPVGNSEKT